MLLLLAVDVVAVCTVSVAFATNVACWAYALLAICCDPLLLLPLCCCCCLSAIIIAMSAVEQYPQKMKKKNIDKLQTSFCRDAFSTKLNTLFCTPSVIFHVFSCVSSIFRYPLRCLLLLNLNVILRVELVSLLMQFIVVKLWMSVLRKSRMLDTHFCWALRAGFTYCTLYLCIPF